MGRFIDEKDGTLRSAATERRTFAQLKSGGSPLAQRILALLTERARYSHELAKALHVHEQKIYYHVRKLETAGLITQERKEEINGGSAKYYQIAASGFCVLLEEPRPTRKISSTRPRQAAFLAPFIKDGKQDFLIVVGSPEGHGPQMARAKDGSYAIDLALFLGSFLDEQPHPVVKLDTEFTAADYKRNLIVVGGPIVNTVARKVNAALPLRFAEDGKAILSAGTNRRYGSDEIGIVVKAQSPFAKEKSVLLIAGRRGAGTRAAILALLKHFDELLAGETRGGALARVVEGRDLDSDGIVDDVVFRE